MIKELRNYQEKAVTGLLRRFDSLLESSENGICILKAPTGSGKTIICAEFLKRFVTDKTTDEKFSFIWISLRGLHHQSKAKLENYYESNNLITCSYFEDLMDKKIDENEILFINWERINKKDINILIQENEQQNDLGSVLKNTKNDGRQIILIIDESHHTAGAPESKKLIEIISPKITFEISATPQLGDTFPETEHVTLNAVKEEQMIKSEITLNPEFNKKKINSQSATDMVLEQALKKREQLKKLYQKVGSNVNPLVLIQIPDKKEKQDKKKEEVIKKLESNFKISEKNNKLAIWLSEDKSKNLPNIEKEDSEVEVLLFKQAIALGWDCPRASILIIFRESTNVTFTIQVIGRIMRMPEPDIGYYSESELNRAFIFTNLSGYTIAQDYAKGYITINESKRRDAIYQDLHLTSVSFKKQREKTRLTGKFVKIFNEISTKNKLKDKLNLKSSKISNPVITDGIITDIDKTGEVNAGMVDLELSETEIQMRFDDFIREACIPFAPRDSGDRMKTALYQIFKDDKKYEKYDPKIQKIILGKDNIKSIFNTITIAKEQYKIKIVEQLKEDKEKIINKNWEIPTLISYTEKFEKKETKLSVMSPFFISKPSIPEKLFMNSLNESKKIKWWFKNGVIDSKFFSVPYIDKHNDEHLFFVDFIVCYNDGKIGLFDTKSGGIDPNIDAKSDGLQKYLTSENKKDKNLIGGILVDVNGSWMYYDKPKSKYNPNDFSEWKILEI